MRILVIGSNRNKQEYLYIESVVQEFKDHIKSFDFQDEISVSSIIDIVTKDMSFTKDASCEEIISAVQENIEDVDTIPVFILEGSIVTDEVVKYLTHLNFCNKEDFFVLRTDISTINIIEDIQAHFGDVIYNSTDDIIEEISHIMAQKQEDEDCGCDCEECDTTLSILENESSEQDTHSIFVGFIDNFLNNIHEYMPKFVRDDKMGVIAGAVLLPEQFSYIFGNQDIKSVIKTRVDGDILGMGIQLSGMGVGSGGQMGITKQDIASQVSIEGLDLNQHYVKLREVNGKYYIVVIFTIADIKTFHVAIKKMIG